LANARVALRIEVGNRFAETRGVQRDYFFFAA
jgi:hypothetical protein